MVDSIPFAFLLVKTPAIFDVSPQLHCQVFGVLVSHSPGVSQQSIIGIASKIPIEPVRNQDFDVAHVILVELSSRMGYFAGFEWDIVWIWGCKI